MFDINKTSDYLFKICSDDKEVDREFLENEMRTWWIRKNISVYLDSEGIGYFRKAMEEIFKNKIIKHNFPENHIEDRLKDIITETYKVPLSERRKLINQELEKLKLDFKEEIKEWAFWIPITNFKLFTDQPFSLGGVTFFILDEKKGEEITEHIKIKDETDERFKKDIQEGYIIPNQGKVFAGVTVRGVQKYAREEAMNKIRMVVNVLHLYTGSREENFGIVGEIIPRFYRKHFEFTIDDDYHSYPMQLVGSLDEFALTPNKIKHMKENELDLLDRMLIKQKPNYFERRILTAIYWFGEAMGSEQLKEKDIHVKKPEIHENLEYFNFGEKYLKLFTALESILIFENHEPITLNISERVAMLLGVNYKERKNIKKILKDLYSVRSKIVHQGYSYVSKHDITALTNVVVRVIFGLLILSKKYKLKQKSDVTDYFEKLKLGCTVINYKNKEFNNQKDAILYDPTVLKEDDIEIHVKK